MSHHSLSKRCLLILVSAPACLSEPVDEAGTGQKLSHALLNPNGPDLAVDAQRLSSSLRVVTGATVTQAEVSEGCARATSGRTLIRFDIKVANFGPNNLEFGAVECRSTSTAAACAGVSCSANPGCCCQGQSTCTTSGGPFGQFFEFACPHGHIHFESFNEYRLLKADGTVAASGHKQSFCLMDLEGATGGVCAAANPYRCGFQGIHAGCADVYSSALPCTYIDATGVADGNYLLEVVVDPMDAINESNESNNVVTVPVTLQNGIAPPPPGPPSGQRFLIRDGVGSASEAATYYQALRPRPYVPGVDTLAQWKADTFGSRALTSALYRNKNELGFWREMTCTTSIGRASGGCAVTNWADVTGPQSGGPNQGTVAMRLDADGRTEFFVFTPAGLLSPSAVLDDEGAKFVPQLCTNCHGGEYRGAQSDPDLGSIFREFEPSQLQMRPGISVAQAEAEWFALNQAITTANAAVRSESEGGPFGVDAAKADMLTYMNAIYVTTSPPVSRAIDDPAHLPPSWQTGATESERVAKTTLWREVVNPYCMTCHRVSSFNYTSYSTFSLLTAQSGGRALLRRYMEVDPNDPNRQQFPFMPQSKLQWTNVSNDAEALIAVDQWLAELARNIIRVVASATDTPRNIPDNNAVGITSSVDIAQNLTLTNLEVNVTIDHTWIGDLVVKLVGPGGFTKVLHNRFGREADNIHQTFVVLEAQGLQSVGRWQLVVSDHEALDAGVLRAWSLTLDGTAGAQNRPPVAHAGSDRTVPAGSSVTLSAAQSSDPDGDALTYQWQRLAGPPITLAPSATSRDVTFVAPQVSVSTDIVIKLTAQDPSGAFGEATVTLTVTPVDASRLVVAASDTPKAIPDNDTTGITSTVAVSQVHIIANLEVTVTIDHTYKGDLRVVLLTPGGVSVTLHNLTGGSADNLYATFSVPQAVGLRTDGSWKLRVSDHAAADTGQLRAWSLDFGIGGTPPPQASCIGACGGQAASGCWCDTQCVNFGDCCPDRAQVCG